MVDMYTPDQLGSIYGDWNPEAYMQGRHQVGLSNQFQDQSLEQQRQKTRSDTLANQFTEQNNPLKLQKQALDNEGLGYDNVGKGVKARYDLATEQFKLNDAQRQEILAAPEHKIKMMAAQAQQMAYDPDPAVQEKGKKLMMLSQSAVEARQKHAEEMEKQDLIRKSAERVAAGNNAAILGAARIAAEARKGAGGGGKAGNIQDLVRTGKLSAEKAAVAFASEANMTEDPEEKANLMRQAQVYEQMAMQLRRAQAEGKPDAAAMTGMPATTIAPALGAPATPAAKPITALPQGAKQIGTSGGKPVYQTPDGRKFIGN